MPALMTLDTLVEALTRFLQITDAQLAQVLDVSPRTVERWKAAATFPQHESRQRLEALEALVHRLDESFKTPDGARLWLHAGRQMLEELGYRLADDRFATMTKVRFCREEIFVNV